MPPREKGPDLLTERIRASEVRLIYEGENSVVPRAEAERLAAETGLDLLVISLDTSPPVVRLIDYGKHKYEIEKKVREARKKQHHIEVKEIKMSVRIDDNDYQVKVRHAIRFLQEGDRVKLTLRLKGREMQHSNLAFDLATQFVADLEEYGSVEGRVRQEGRAFTANITPKATPTVKKAAAKSPKPKESASSEPAPAPQEKASVTAPAAQEATESPAASDE